ncbi:NrfD/PsrC family molybdoenzyme membrane anchor subunit [Chloroflexota bacterium]
MSTQETEYPVWRRPIPEEEDLAEHLRRRHLLLDPKFPWEMNDDVLRPMYRTRPIFWVFFVALGGLVLMGAITWGYQIYWGIGITGLNRPIMWGLFLVNTVYFIGIGHAGTFISAALRVLKIEWRRPISRAAEALTLFALAAAGLSILMHLGRVWKAYWLLPYPNERGLWPNWHSPLMWDLMAILTYMTGSTLFIYVGLLPDIAMARDHTQGWRNRLYSVLSLGWRGTEREWAFHETTLNIFSYVIIPVMFSVHTIVSWDFAMALQPGWHSTIFGPYFIIGALFSGVAAVIIVMAVVRKAMHLEYFLRAEHFNGMGMFLLLLSFAWAYFYFNDYIVPWYGGEPVMHVVFDIFRRGWAAPLWFLMIFANIILPWATLWSKRVRSNIAALVIICLLIQIGMYLERYLIVPVMLGFNELPFSWGVYIPRSGVILTIACLAMVVLMYMLFTRFFPIIPVWEVLEGQIHSGLRRIGRALVPTRSEPH